MCVCARKIEPGGTITWQEEFRPRLHGVRGIVAVLYCSMIYVRGCLLPPLTLTLVWLFLSFVWCHRRTATSPWTSTDPIRTPTRGHASKLPPITGERRPHSSSLIYFLYFFNILWQQIQSGLWEQRRWTDLRSVCHWLYFEFLDKNHFLFHNFIFSEVQILWWLLIWFLLINNEWPMIRRLSRNQPVIKTVCCFWKSNLISWFIFVSLSFSTFTY